MSLIVIITNDGTGSDEAANYHYRVLVNQREIAFGHVGGHDRSKRWRDLLKLVVEDGKP